MTDLVEQADGPRARAPASALERLLERVASGSLAPMAGEDSQSGGTLPGGGNSENLDPDQREAQSARPGAEPPTANPQTDAAAKLTTNLTAAKRAGGRPHAPEPPPDVSPSSLLDGRYKLLRLIGEGGMGRVFRAQHLRTGREVAVKRLWPFLAVESGIRARFAEEAQITTKLQHPNVVEVLDAGVDPEGRPFFVMELLEGESLESRLRRSGRIDWRESLAILIQVASALAYAHGQGVVHRDLKPGNIVLCRDRSGQTCIKLIDFGLAHLCESRHNKSWTTRTGQPLGSPPTMSPEQAEGGELDGRSDIYALACLAYRMIAGAYPFQVHSYSEYIYHHLHIEAPVLQLPPSGDEGAEMLASLFRGCLSKSPDDRPDTMSDLRDALQLILDGYCEQVDPALLGTKSRRRTYLTGGLALGLVGMTALVSAALWQSQPRATVSGSALETHPPGGLSAEPEASQPKVARLSTSGPKAVNADPARPPNTPLVEPAVTAEAPPQRSAHAGRYRKKGPTGPRAGRTTPGKSRQATGKRERGKQARPQLLGSIQPTNASAVRKPTLHHSKSASTATERNRKCHERDVGGLVVPDPSCRKNRTKTSVKPQSRRTEKKNKVDRGLIDPFR